MAKKNKGHIYGTPLRLPGERGAQEGQSRAVPMEYLGAPLASERSGLFCFVSLRPTSSDGLHKMFLTAYKMDFWLPTGTPRAAAKNPGSPCRAAGKQASVAPGFCQHPDPSSESFQSF